MKFILLVLFLLSGSAFAQSLDLKRTVVINSVIQKGNILTLTTDMEKMAAADRVAPINIVINSPGGDVVTGFAFINYMESLKQKGVTLNCYVPSMAASMAFQIYLHCDNRYALNKSFLLWHGVRVQIGGGLFGGGQTMTAKSTQLLATDLKAVDAVIIAELKEALNLDLKTIMYHFDAETLHIGSNLSAMDPAFVTTSDAIPGLLEALDDPKCPGVRDSEMGQLEFEPGEIVYIKGE